ncbi:(2Fe-2S)-binding protein [Kitasatospora sp. NPDC051170]|uniref:(2Fe-2S)-binding protein n=1 Tax=Kitasatospora sp. NPDC051170 TaxID=3364056 RepID=UPI0037A40DED
MLDEYVDEVGHLLGTTQRRVAASTLHLGVAARLWSVALGVLAFTGRVPDLAPERLHWRRVESGPLPPWLPAPTAVPGPPGEDPARALTATVLRSALDPLGAAMRARYGLSAHTLRGNAASALVGAARMLHTRAADAPYPPLPAVTALLTAGPLATAGEFTPDPITYRRRNCCLYYRVPGAGMCGDCVLTRV